MVAKLTIDWGEADLAPDQRRRWMASWLVSREGEEGEYFFEGQGSQQTQHDVPVEAIGFRLRWWPSENTVAQNLEFGPIAQLADDYFFDPGSERLIKVGALDLVR